MGLCCMPWCKGLLEICECIKCMGQYYRTIQTLICCGLTHLDCWVSSLPHVLSHQSSLGISIENCQLPHAKTVPEKVLITKQNECSQSHNQVHSLALFYLAVQIQPMLWTCCTKYYLFYFCCNAMCNISDASIFEDIFSHEISFNDNNDNN